MDGQDLYNVRDPPRMGIEKKREKERRKREKKKGEDSSNWRDFGNLCNLVLKKEE